MVVCVGIFLEGLFEKSPSNSPKTFKQIYIGMCTVIFLWTPRSPKPGPNSQFWGVLFFRTQTKRFLSTP